MGSKSEQNIRDKASGTASRENKEREPRANVPLNRRRFFYGGAAVLSGLASLFGAYWLNKQKGPTAPPVITDLPDLPDRRLDLTRMRSNISILAQKDWEGRLAGSPGQTKAGEYMARLWSSWGLKPKGDGETFFQSFPVPSFSLSPVNGRMHLVAGENKGNLADNLIGMIPGRDPALRHEVVALSAHYDHLGKWDNQVYPGANDNASGVAVLLEIAKAAIQSPTRRSLAFFLFSGEEGGLIGSKYYVEHPSIPLESLIGLVNLDTVANGDKSDFIYWSSGNLPWREVMEEAARATNIRLQPQDRGMHNSDHFPFAEKGVPAISVLSGTWLEGNHTPGDTLSIINTEKLQKIAEWSWRFVYTLAESAGK
ncbi:M28 family metallopeptidase [Heliobacterium mobile]|uniref:M28 family metallopeptidase n=1 Tax=Heliobacterium mobile TaxID=28064 RepID=UPI0014793200|nr:M28 family peptidase [Heliobacterium mobile]